MDNNKVHHVQYIVPLEEPKYLASKLFNDSMDGNHVAGSELILSLRLFRGFSIFPCPPILISSKPARVSSIKGQDTKDSFPRNNDF